MSAKIIYIPPPGTAVSATKRLIEQGAVAMGRAGVDNVHNTGAVLNSERAQLTRMLEG
jgi:hypothetical protein